METGSYLELALTLYGWQVSNRIAELLVASGLIYIPLLWLVMRNWTQPARSQEAKAAAPVSMRRMEQDMLIAFIAIILCFIPAVSVQTSDITHTSRITEKEITANSPDAPYASGEIPDEIKVPVYWWLVHQLSTGFTNIFTASIHSFGKPSHIRDITLELDYMSLDEPSLRAELKQFDLDCHLPALRKLEQENPVAVNATTLDRFYSGTPSQWRAAAIFFDTPGYYDSPKSIATQPIPAWTGHYDFIDGNAGPRCDVWWKDKSNGLERRIYDDIVKKTGNSDHDSALSGYLRAGAGKNQQKVNTVRRVLLKEPPPANMGADVTGDGAKGDGLGATVGYVGGLVVFPAIKGAMYLVKTGLPMFQALALMCIYIAIPFAVPFAVLKPSLLLFFTSAIFSLKFMTGLWALAALLDDKLIKYMYGENELHTGVGSPPDLVLSIVTATSYVSLPIVWIWLVSSFTGSSVSGVNSLFAYTAGKLDASGQAGQSVAVKAATAGKKSLAEPTT